MQMEQKFGDHRMAPPEHHFANGGIDDPDNSKIESLYVFDSTLYAVANNNIDGVKVCGD